MIDKKTIAMFEEQQIRRIWHEDERYFVLEDIILALVNSNDPKQYIKKMRQRDPELQKGWVQFVPTLKVPTSGGLQKMNCINTQSALRLIQSIPSPKAEPFKLWLASLGNQRVEESNDPELGMQRARERAIQVYRGRGMSDKEIEQRLQTIDTRHHYTDELKARGIKDGLEYALLTNISYHRSGKTAKEYKEHKGLINTDNLRDHMTRTEMLLTGLSEEAGVEIAKSKDAKGFEEVQDALVQGADIAKKTKEHLEEKVGKSILEPNNRLTPKQKALRKKVHHQERLGYNKKRKGN